MRVCSRVTQKTLQWYQLLPRLTFSNMSQELQIESRLSVESMKLYPVLLLYAYIYPSHVLYDLILAKRIKLKRISMQLVPLVNVSKKHGK